jgi:hypothetical protein
MEGTENLTNMERFYAAQANSALDAFNARNWALCDSICTELLVLPRLPYLFKAQCSLMATKDNDSSLEYAKDTVKYYDRCLENKPDSEDLGERAEGESQLLLEAAQQKLAAQTATNDTEKDGDVEEGESKVKTSKEGQQADQSGQAKDGKEEDASGSGDDERDAGEREGK